MPIRLWSTVVSQLQMPVLVRRRLSLAADAGVASGGCHAIASPGYFSADRYADDVGDLLVGRVPAVRALHDGSNWPAPSVVISDPGFIMRRVLDPEREMLRSFG